MKKLIITAAVLAMALPLGGCADDGGYSTGYYDPYYGSGYYSTNYYDAPTYYRHHNYDEYRNYNGGWRY